MRKFQNPVQILSQHTNISDVDLIFKPDEVLITPIQALTTIDIVKKEYNTELLKYEKLISELEKNEKISMSEYYKKYNITL